MLCGTSLKDLFVISSKEVSFSHPHDCLLTKTAGNFITSSVCFPSILSKRALIAFSQISSKGWLTVVREGVVNFALVISSNPHIVLFLETSIPYFWDKSSIAFSAPNAMSSFEKTATSYWISFKITSFIILYPVFELKSPSNIISSSTEILFSSNTSK
jgi:hypothetical protein